MLEPLAGLSGTPIARLTGRLRERLAGCEQFLVHAVHSPGRDRWAFLDSVRCVAEAEVPASIRALRAGDDLAFAFELGGGRRLSGRLLRARTGDVSIVASVEAPQEPGLAALLLPADEPVGAGALSAAQALVHARLRPASGLNLAALVSRESQADQMFRLRSELFAGAVLDGTWEFAIYMPRTGQMTPPMALALDYNLRSAARAAMQSFVGELETTWPIHHSQHAIAGYPGACFHDLRLLPDLTPCYVVTERSIVIGWNPASLSLALRPAASGAGVSPAHFGKAGGLLVDLGRLSRADRLLQRQLGGGEAGAGPDGYGWDELRLEGTREGDRLQFRVSLGSGGAS